MAGDLCRCAPIAAVAGMVDGAQRVIAGVAVGEGGVEIVPGPGLGSRDHGDVVGTGAAPDLHMVEIQLHATTIGGVAVPVDGDDAGLAGQLRCGRYARRRHILCDIDKRHRRPVAKLVAVGGDRTHTHLDCGTAVEIAPAQCGVGGHAGTAPRLPGGVGTPFNPVRVDLDAGVVGRLRDPGPLRGGEPARVPVRVQIRVGLHHKPGRSHRDTMVLFRCRCGP